MKARRAISPVIATVIIVAVAIAISIAVAGWLFGLWGGFAGGQPEIQVSGAIVDDTGAITIYISNTGSGSDTLISVEVIYNNTTWPTNISNVVIPANSTETVTGQTQQVNNTSFSANPGDSAILVLYFEKTGTHRIPVTISP